MPVSLYAPFDEADSDSLLVIDRVDNENNANSLVDKIAIRELVSELSNRDKTIILMRYFYDKTQSEIATLLHISQVQVSRLENKILENLKKKLS